MKKILLQQYTAGCRIRHNAIPPAFGGLGPNTKHAGGRINVVGSEPAEFLAPQCRIVGKRKHRAIADRLSTCRCQNRLPVCFVGNPRQASVSPYEAPPISAHYRVPGANSFLHEVDIEESEDGD